MTSFGNTRSVLGAIITLSCIRVSSCASFPRIPEHMNLMEVPTSTDYELDAEENTNLFVGQVAAFTCSDIEVPGTITHWLKDDAKVASSKFLSKEDMKRLFGQHVIRTSIGWRPPPIHSSFPSKIDGDNTNSTSTEFTVRSNGRLFLRNVKKSHEGKYSCLIEEFHGMILRRQFDVTVTDAPRCSLQPTTKQYLYRRSNTRLQCSLNFKNVVFRHWKKNGKDIIADGFSEKFNSLDNGALHIFDLAPEDSGNYTCHVKTPLGEISCGTAELHVFDEDVSYDVSVVYHPPNVTVRPPHNTAELECLVNIVNASYGWARPPPELICGGRICPENRLGHSPRNNNLILKKVSAEDTGYYECIARVPDDRNMAKTSLYLNVLTKPEITVEYRSKVVLLAKRIKITCSVGSSNPPAKVYWVKDGVRTDTMKGRGISAELEGETAFLTIASAEYSHRGHYQCVAYNGVGTVSSETFLNVPEGQPPPTPRNVTAVAIAPSKVYVSWVYTNSSAIHSFMVTSETDHAQMKNYVCENTDRNFMLTNLHPFTNYTIKVTGYSKKSPSETAAIRIQTPEGQPCGRVPDHAINAINVSPTVILLTWESLPLKDRCGIITQYKVMCMVSKDDIYDTYYSYVNNSLGPSDRGITTQYKIFSDLQPGADYLFSIVALTSKGSGPESILVDAKTYTESVKSCMTNGSTVFQHVQGQMDGARNVNISWTLHDNSSAEAIRVSLISVDGVVKEKKTLEINDGAVVLTIHDKQPVYLIRMEVLDYEWDVCETYNFTVVRQDRRTLKKRTLPTIDFGSSVGAHCIQFGWDYNSTDKCTYIVRYKRLLEAHFEYLNTSSKNVTICNLQPWSDYEYGVAVLPGPLSKYNKLEYAVSDTHIRTEESEPGIPQDLRCSFEKSSFVLCAWSAPIISYGLIRNYTLRYHENAKENVFENVSNDTKITLKCLLPGRLYSFQVLATNNAGNSILSVSVQIFVPPYNRELSNCSVLMTYDDQSDGDKGSSEMDDVTFGIIIAASVLSICLALVLTLTCVCYPDYFRWRLCKRKCLGLAGKNITKNKAMSNGKTANQNGQKPRGEVRLEMLTEQNTLLLSNGNATMNGKISNGNDGDHVKKNGIHKTSIMDDSVVKQEVRYKNGAEKGWKIFKSKPRKMAAVPEYTAIMNEQSQHLILSVPVPKHRSLSSDARSSTCTRGSMSIDSIIEETDILKCPGN